MQNSSLRERTIGALQQDRLSNFIKESTEVGSECFFYALIGAWNRIYPDQVLPRDIEDKIVHLDEKNGVAISEVPEKITQLKSLLNLEITRIEIPPNIGLEPEEFRADFDLPATVPIVKNTTGTYRALNPQSSGLVFLKPKGEGTFAHWICLHPTPRFAGLGENHYVMGGQEGFEQAKENNLEVGLVIHVSAAPLTSANQSSRTQ
jgi:hypothetical protein